MNLNIKVIISGGIIQNVLKDQDVTVHVEIIDIDKDYEDYEKLEEYCASVCSNPAFMDCSYAVANFEDS